MRLRFGLCILLLAQVLSLGAQVPIRPDAFPPSDDGTNAPKSLLMADTDSAMADWRHYPTYGCYVAMMRGFAQRYPALCSLDTIGFSVNGRLILCVRISSATERESGRPQVFLSSTMHGDELVGFHLMLHLIDTILRSYGDSELITNLVNATDIYINPLSNPDGTYYGGDYSVANSRRYNANGVDLNRNYPDPFGSTAKSLEPENDAMIQYVGAHNFLLSANIHSGSEVMNYPWDSFTSAQRRHPDADWWEAVSKRFVDSCRLVDDALFRSVNNAGYIEGGDWYVISNGRQDYMNYYHGIRELTMELSDVKKLSSEQLQRYWNAMALPLLRYIGEAHSIPTSVAVPFAEETRCNVYPNPTRGLTTVVTPLGSTTIDVSALPPGVHFVEVSGYVVRIVKI